MVESNNNSGKPFPFALSPLPCNSIGFTLVELLVAISLVSIVTGMVFTFYLFAHKQIRRQEEKHFQFQSSQLLMQTIANNIRKSRKTVSLDEIHWTFVRQNGDTATYLFENGELQFNDKVLIIGGRDLSSFSFTCFGKDTLLDMDGDKDVDFEEVDLNSDGKIDEEETGNIARIKAVLTMGDDASYVLWVEEGAKNNL